MVKESEALPMPELTKRENICLKHLAIDCLVTKDIAHKMGITDRTVRLMFDNLRHKFDCITDAAIIAKVYLSGWDKLL